MSSSTRALRRWSWIHTWSSLVCTAFMLLLCITGLPLIFHHEIGHWLGNIVEPPEMAANAPRVSMDHVLEQAQARFPGKVVKFASQEVDDDRVWYVSLADGLGRGTNFTQAAVDARSGEVLNEPPLGKGFMHVMFKLHTDLFAGLPGMLFLGFMGMLLVLSLVSGTVLYAPFMRKLRFGEVRQARGPRIKWLDMHNVQGIVTLVWLTVVGATGVINTWADLLVDHWKNNQLAEMVSAYQALPRPEKLGSLDTAVRAALAQEPGMAIKFIAFPGTSFTSPHHYAIFMRGDSPLTQRILKPVLVDAVTGKVTDSREMPWYFYILKLSQPLHFGDYGGLPLQIIWALLDMASIIVLGSGLYLWLARRKLRAARLEAPGSGTAVAEAAR